MKKGLLLLMMSFSLLGIADAGFITWEKIRGIIPTCTQGFKCGEVLTSKWSSVGPIPLSALGMLFYMTFLVLAILAYLDVEQVKLAGRKLSMHAVVLGLGIFGALFSAYLMTIMGLILNAWCLYCLLSAINCMILFVLSGSVYHLHRKGNEYES